MLALSPFSSISKGLFIRGKPTPDESGYVIWSAFQRMVPTGDALPEAG
jgi:hypothetical protein